MKKGTFDNSAFFSALDAHRSAKGLTWKQVAEKSGVSASTLTRIAQGKRPDVDSLAALTSWSGLNADDFVRNGSHGDKKPETLAVISTYLRADRNLSAEGAIALEEVIKSTYARIRKK